MLEFMHEQLKRQQQILEVHRDITVDMITSPGSPLSYVFSVR
jgi:hypothetical protein